MIEKVDSKLKVFNASAGSGKTYHLVKEYIKLLINKNQPSFFSHIIAMTFTNKAALEMKQRIITGLDEISSPELFNFKLDQLTQDLAHELSISKDDVIARCKQALTNILHQYEDFHIMTIDKFNLRLIRSFSRDLDLSADFDVQMDEKEVIGNIVDSLLNELGQEESQKLNNLLFRYAKANVEEGTSWNFRNNLIDFAGIIRSERNKKQVDKLILMDFSVETYGQLNGRMKHISSTYQAKIESFKEVLSRTELDKAELPGGGHTFNDLNGILKKIDFNSKKPPISNRLLKNLSVESEKCIPIELREKCFAIQDYWNDHLKEFASTELYLKNYFNMALLQYIAKALQQIKKEEQIILISEFNALISELIQKENTPFIYERLGTRFRHFLLDEFQDTSHLQWLNLVPLIHESLGNNHENLIVGDPKQSIYRFKNGVAEQFVELPKIYNPENIPEINRKSQFFSTMGEVAVLENNWRSNSNIVLFNNAFFKTLKNYMSETSSAFYNSIEQTPKSNVKGKLSIRSQKESPDSEDILTILINWIEECKNDGFNYGDICVLGETNKKCNEWAIGLAEAGYKIVSADSLQIHSDIKVQLTIAYLKWRFNPDGETEKRQFAELFFRIRKESFKQYHPFLEKQLTKKGGTYYSFNTKHFLETYFTNYNHFFFKYESLYDLVQGFYQLAEFNEIQNSYLHHLADIVFEFELKKGPDLKLFLEYYNRKKDTIAVQVPESNDSIRVMTIHKSKGLEFPVVLLPNMDFSLALKGKLIIESDDFLFYTLPAQNSMLQPIKEAYDTEINQVFTDKINLCYVGMTRPVERLYINNQFKNDANFGVLYHETLKKHPDASINGEEVSIELGSNERTSIAEKKESEIFTPTNVSDKLWFPDIALQDRPELNDTAYLSPEMQFGLEFHLIASQIDEASMINEALDKNIREGLVSASNRDALALKLNSLLSFSDYTELFKNKSRVLNEVAIIQNENSVIRPDKVIVKENETIIIDFKTGMPSSKDEKQIRNYKNVFTEMQYPNVKGYLYYVSLSELRPV